MGFLKKIFGSKDSDDKSPFSEKKMKTLSPTLVNEPFGKINYWDLPDGGKRVRVYILMENPIEGAQTGVAVDGSFSMLKAFGKDLQEARKATQVEIQALRNAGITSANDPRLLAVFLKLGILQVKNAAAGENIVEVQVRQMTEYLSKFDADGGTTVVYWATGGDGSQIEVVGDLTGPECPTAKFDGPKDFGMQTKLLPAIKYFVERFNDATWGIYIFITDGELHDLDEVKKYCVQLAKDIVAGRRNDLKFVLLGVGDEINEDQMEELDDLETGTDLDLWDHKIATEMRQLAEIFAEVVSETVIIAPNDGLIRDSYGNVVKDYRDTGLPALMVFELPPGANAFELELGGQVVKQPIVENYTI